MASFDADRAGQRGDALFSLRDVPGVEGSFLVARDGRLLARDLAAFFPDDLLEDVAPRLLRMGESFASEGGDMMSCVLRYREHLLFVRGMPGGLLCALGSADTNVPALRMGANLVVRRLSALATPPPVPQARRTTASQPVAASQLNERPSAQIPIPLDRPSASRAVAAEPQPATPPRRFRGAVIKDPS